ncbi:MAG: thermonuclease family protein [Pirellulales bacterium]|nr:thermonuclease family protein [Pirellulales bacterium]
MPPRPGRRRMPWWVALCVLLVLAARQYSQWNSATHQAPDTRRPSPPARGVTPATDEPPAETAARTAQPQTDNDWVGAQRGAYRVQRVVDGDTLLLDNDQRVRLIGVDTPESVKPDTPVQPFGKEATAFTRQFLAAGQNRVRLEFDQERTDDYGRLLAYVWVGDRMLNEELLRAGLGRALLRHPYSQAMKDRFKAAQQDARRQRLGIWSDER